MSFCHHLQTEVVSRFDALIDNLYERYKDRYFVGDVCTLDDSDNQKCVLFRPILAVLQASTGALITLFSPSELWSA